MKNLDFKKLLVFIAIIVIVVLLLFVGFKFVGGGSKVNDEEREKIDDVMQNYFAKITEGYTTTYNGIDVLYSKDKTTYEDLDTKAVLNMAAKYASNNDLDVNVSISDLEALDKTGTYGKISEYTAYNGKGIRDAVKELFGAEIDSQSAVSTSGYIYNFYYVSDYDIYLMKRNDVYDVSSKLQTVEYKVVDTVKKGDKYITTVAVAYTYNNGQNIIYASDSKGENVVSSDTNEFPVDKINDFSKYKFTMSLDNNGHYVFESVEKVK